MRLPDKVSIVTGGGKGIGNAVPTGTIETCEGGYPGLFDLSGNVWEWTLDCNTVECRRQSGDYSSYHSQGYLHCDFSDPQNPTTVHAGTGFRCCLSL